jgi:hypothetical protein
VAVDEVAIDAITEDEARAAGAASRRRLVEELRRHDRARTYRIALRFAGPDRRAALRPEADLGVAVEVLKRRVRRLKELGLTESLGTGYRLSPRGEAYVERRRPE